MAQSKIMHLGKSPQTVSLQAQILALLHQACFETPWHEKSFEELLKLPSTIGWYNSDGFLLCSHIFDEMEILTVCSHPNKRRQGIAKGFLNEMTAYAEKNGVRKIYLEVSSENDAAKALYKSFGFEQNGIRKNYYKTPHGQVDALCLIKKL